MHPPTFHRSQPLSAWPGCSLEVACPCSPRVTMLPVRMLLAQRGDITFGAVLDGLRCSACRGKPAPVYLVAGHNRRFINGPPADWSLELVVPPVMPTPGRV